MDIPLWSVIGTIVGALSALVLTWFGQMRTSARQEAAERDRLNSEVLGRALTAVLPADSAEGAVPPLAPAAGQAPPRNQPPPHDQASSMQESAASRDAVYDQLLINDYALGLTQARRAFNVSMSFSVLGGLVLVLGVALAIFRADTGSQVAGAAITSVAGVLTAGLSQLFRDQSTKALKHLESQAVELRKDVRAQINAATAQRLLEDVADGELRSRLQAALILEFTGAKLPDHGGPWSGSPGSLDGKGLAAGREASS